MTVRIVCHKCADFGIVVCIVCGVVELKALVTLRKGRADVNVDEGEGGLSDTRAGDGSLAARLEDRKKFVKVRSTEPVRGCPKINLRIVVNVRAA